jgi:hypothetical protein
MLQCVSDDSEILVDMSGMYGNNGPAAEVPSPPPGFPPPPPSPSRRRLSRGAKAAIAVGGCVVVAGAAFGVTELVSTPTSAAASSAAASNTANTIQAAALSDDLSAAAGKHPLRAIARLRALGGVHGQFTYETKKGARTLAFERGSVVSVAGQNVTVKAKDGTTWTWALTGTSVVRQNGTKTSESALTAGETVLAAGPVTGRTRDARLVVIRK